VELVDLCSQDEIALRQTVDLVRPGCDLDFSPGKEDVWVVPLLVPPENSEQPKGRRYSSK